MTEPDTIRVWRRAVDGSTDSCAGRVDVIPFEDYVKGVVPHEWFPSWDSKALEMGAVCARSYAWALVNSGGKYHCADVDDTAASQVYKDSGTAKTDAAVDATSGVAVVKDGKILLAMYSAENGDPTADGVDEPYCAGSTVNGHGHGVCQWGTPRWAVNEGKDYLGMVPHYYPGATVNGDPRPALAAQLASSTMPVQMLAGDEVAATIVVDNVGYQTWDETTTLVPGDAVFAAPSVMIDTPAAMGDSAVFDVRLRAPQVTTATRYTQTFHVESANVSFADVSFEILVVPAVGPMGPPGSNDQPGCGVGGRGGAPWILLVGLLALVLKTWHGQRKHHAS
jgi:hypothetical protein